MRQPLVTTSPTRRIRTPGWWIAPLAAMLSILLTGTAALAAGGPLDPTFDGDGMVRTDLTFGGDAVVDVAIQPDAKIVAAGEAGVDFAVVRYTPTGALDASFGTAGVTTIDFGGDDNPWALALQADGKIVIVGGSTVSGDILLARLNADGSLDTTFGTGGTVITDLGGYETANGVAIQADGRIVIAGHASVEGQGSDFLVARYASGGSLDATFGGDGVVTTDFPAPGDFTLAEDVGESLALQTDGRIVVAGTSTRRPGEFERVRDFALARYLSDGSLDATFGGDGTVVTNVGQSGGVVTETFDYAYAMTIQPDGRIVAAGQTENNWLGSFGLVRYAVDGSLDPSFGGDGRVVTSFGGEGAFASSSSAFDVAIQVDGKVVAAGHVENPTTDFALVRYDGAGNLDATFDVDGRVETEFGPDHNNTYRDSAYAVAIQLDGRIVAAGSSSSALALARYLPGGAAALPQCADGGDNDADGRTDFPADPGCESATDDSEAPDPALLAQCADGLDNDGDALTDYPADPGCESATDESESPDPAKQCADGLDNDGDALVDFGSDPGCESATDDSEAPDPAVQCADGLDNDKDGSTDYPADPGCESIKDDSESPDPAPLAECSDGLDNDGDGRTDYPADRNCESATDDSESRVRPAAQCSDGLDNDSDGLIDYPADPGCRSASDKSESNKPGRPAAASVRSESEGGLRIQ